MAQRLSNGDVFFKTILDAMPIHVFVVDEDVRILEYNKTASSLLGRKPEKMIRMGCGDALHCIHSTETPEGCGHSESCRKCVVRNSVNTSYKGRNVFRQKYKMRLISGEELRNVYFRVTTNPFTYKEGVLVLLMLEDVTELTELMEILPICVHCKRVRSDRQYWENVENYLLKHMDVKFSHGICPDCLNKFYPDARQRQN